MCAERLNLSTPAESEPATSLATSAENPLEPTAETTANNTPETASEPPRELTEKEIKAAEYILSHESLFQALDEPAEINVAAVEEFQKIPQGDLMRQLEAMAELPLVDRLAVLASDQFGPEKLDYALGRLEDSDTTANAGPFKRLLQIDTLRASLDALMLGTPQREAYVAAMNLAFQEDGEPPIDETSVLWGTAWKQDDTKRHWSPGPPGPPPGPPMLWYASDPELRQKLQREHEQKEEQEMRATQLAGWRKIITSYDAIAADYAEQHPELSGKELAAAQHAEVQDVFFEALDRWAGRAEIGFQGMVAAARLGEYSKQMLLTLPSVMLQYGLNFTKLERFAGHSGPRLAKWSKDITPQDIMSQIQHVEGQESLCEKAIALAKVIPDPAEDGPDLAWIENVPLDTIDRCFAMGDDDDADPAAIRLRARAEMNGLTVEQLAEYPWLAPPNLEPGNTSEIQSFPFDGTDKMRYDWCYDHGMVQLQGPWNRQTLGKIIFTRLQTDREHNLHDASQWLSAFRIPEIDYDIKAIKADVAAGKTIDDLTAYERVLRSPETELDFLASILGAEPEKRQRLNLSDKPQMIEKLFSDPKNALIYRQLLGIYRKSDLSVEDLQAAVDSELAAIAEGGDPQRGAKEGTNDIEPEFVRERMSAIIERLAGEQQANVRIGEIMRSLMVIGDNRKAYVDDATGFLTRHMVTPQNYLTAAWPDRAQALARGTRDSAAQIRLYQLKQGLSDYCTEHGLDMEHYTSGRYGEITEALLLKYSTKAVIEAVDFIEQKGEPDKVLPADVKAIELDGKIYVGKIPKWDDPLGMTCGYDTGCCMTLDEGASESCIWQGYSDRQAGFFAIYDQNKHIMAQSFTYVNPENPDVVVMDNIEANAGRDAGKVIRIYQEYLRDYLLRQFAEHPDWTIRQVNVGAKYGEVAKAQVERLEPTAIIPNPNPDTYTDADEDQRLLIRLTDAEIAAARASGNQ